MFFLFVLTAVVLLLLPAAAHAQCPVCTVAVVGGLGLSRWLGIDDTVTGLWVGAALLLMGFWTSKWLRKRWKDWSPALTDYICITIYWLLTVPWLYIFNFAGHPLNRLWGIDKLLVGILVGTVLFLLGFYGDRILRMQREDGKAHFPYQKVILPVTPLILASVFFYFITLK